MTIKCLFSYILWGKNSYLTILKGYDMINLRGLSLQVFLNCKFLFLFSFFYQAMFLLWLLQDFVLDHSITVYLTNKFLAFGTLSSSCQLCFISACKCFNSLHTIYLTCLVYTEHPAGLCLTPPTSMLHITCYLPYNRSRSE